VQVLPVPFFMALMVLPSAASHMLEEPEEEGCQDPKERGVGIILF